MTTTKKKVVKKVAVKKVKKAKVFPFRVKVSVTNTVKGRNISRTITFEAGSNVTKSIEKVGAEVVKAL